MAGATKHFSFLLKIYDINHVQNDTFTNTNVKISHLATRYSNHRRRGVPLPVLGKAILSEMSHILCISGKNMTTSTHVKDMGKCNLGS